METTESKLFAKAKGRSKTSYHEVKDAEYGGQRDLPGGLEGECMLTGAKLGEYKSGKSEGKVYVTLYRNVIEPEEYSGVYCGETIPVEETHWASEAENQGRIIGILKKFGYEEIIAAGHPSFMDMLSEVMATIQDDRRTCGFEVSTRTNRNGEHYFNLTDPTPDDYKLPSYFKHPADRQATKKTAKPKSSGQSQPAKKGGATKRGGAKKATKGATCPFTQGQTVLVDSSMFEDGNAYLGEIRSIEVHSKTCEIFFPDDNSTMDIVWDKLSEHTPAEAPEEAGWQTGDRVRSCNNHFGDDTNYEGEIKSLSDETALVAWDDETESEIPLENIEVPS